MGTGLEYQKMIHEPRPHSSIRSKIDDRDKIRGRKG